MDDTWRWFHCTTHTYGAWLPGDPRGFRTRHHREHVEGDYKNPPPEGKYDQRHEQSKWLMTQPAVVLPRELRGPVGAALREKLNEYGSRVLCVAVGGQHVHLLAKMPPGPFPRLWLGHAKREATFRLKAHGWTGKVWAVRSKITPIVDRGHQENTFHYILRHEQEGAWIWDFRQPHPD